MQMRSHLAQTAPWLTKEQVSSKVPLTWPRVECRSSGRRHCLCTAMLAVADDDESNDKLNQCRLLCGVGTLPCAPKTMASASAVESQKSVTKSTKWRNRLGKRRSRPPVRHAARRSMNNEWRASGAHQWISVILREHKAP